MEEEVTAGRGAVAGDCSRLRGSSKPVTSRRRTQRQGGGVRGKIDRERREDERRGRGAMDGPEQVEVAVAVAVLLRLSFCSSLSRPAAVCHCACPPSAPLPQASAGGEGG